MKVYWPTVLALCSILFMHSALLAAEVSIDANTILRIEQRDIIGSNKQTILPITQFLGFDAVNLADSNLSLHFYGWGRADLGDNSYNQNKTDGGFTYGYLQYRFNAANADIRAGRFSVREGIVHEQIDGVNARTDLPFGFGISAFGGATVHNRNLYRENSDGKGDYLAGGRLNYRYKGLLDIGFSGVYEGAAPTLLYYANGNHRLVGGDIWLTPSKGVELIGHSSYNTDTSGFAEHSYLLNLKPIQHLTLSTEFNDYQDKSYFHSWAMFSGSLFNPDDKSPSIGTVLSGKSRTIGTILTYDMGKGVEISGDYKHYTRETGSADRYGGELKLRFLDNSLRTGFGYHYLSAGESFAIGATPTASYHEVRTYALHDTKSYFAALDLLGYLFKDKIYDEKSALEGILSLGYHITPDLAVSGDISYGRNPEFIQETKGLIRLTYNPVFAAKGEKK